MREKINFDKDWYFHQGDIKPKQAPNYKDIAYISAKTERMHQGPACKDYIITTVKNENTIEHKEERWDKVDLPHDYVIGGIPSEEYGLARGYLKYDNAWYIKYFELGEEDRNRRITLLFEGVATHATVYLNGCLMKHNFCGYTSFEVDLTDLVRFDVKNVLSVYVNTEQNEGWWYEGGGIYRHVWLCKTDLLSVDLWGVWAKPVFENGAWTVKTETTVRNDTLTPTDFEVQGEILNAEGEVLYTSVAQGHVADKDKTVVFDTIPIENVRLWSPDDPYQYTLRTTILKGGQAVDEISVRFGCRTLSCTARDGLRINGKKYIVKGFCGHADCGLMGKAVPDNIHRYKVQLMKEMGANGYRTSHYPQAEALMDALDENGFIVLNETRWFESTEEGLAQLEMLMKRDRNRPSVIFWSVGNEEPHHSTEQGKRICGTMMSFARKLDDTRFIMAAVNRPATCTVYEENEVIGINYHLFEYDMVHERYPEKAILASECCATGTTRGWYFNADDNYAFMPAWDKDTTKNFVARENTWKFLTSRDYIIGCYQWIAFEHRGETVWPRLCSQSGAIDLFLQKKDAYYHNKALWTTEPLVHLLPHWNWRGREGDTVTVRAYTNVSELELFLNGTSLGKRKIEQYGHGEWEVPYAAGELRVVAYQNGSIVAEDRRVTTDEPYRLCLSQDTPDVTANGEDIAVFSCFVTDKEGREVPDATPTVYFTTAGDCRVYSTGSDITEHDTIFKPYRRMRAGRISVAVKLGMEAQGMKLYAKADGLQMTYININTK